MTPPTVRLLDTELTPIADFSGHVRRFTRTTDWTHPDSGRAGFGFVTAGTKGAVRATLDVARNHPIMDQILSAKDATEHMGIATVWDRKLERWAVEGIHHRSNDTVVTFSLRPVDPYVEQALLEKHILTAMAAESQPEPKPKKKRKKAEKA